MITKPDDHLQRIYKIEVYIHKAIVNIKILYYFLKINLLDAANYELEKLVLNRLFGLK